MNERIALKIGRNYGPIFRLLSGWQFKLSEKYTSHLSEDLANDVQGLIWESILDFYQQAEAFSDHLIRTNFNFKAAEAYFLSSFVEQYEYPLTRIGSGTSASQVEYSDVSYMMGERSALTRQRLWKKLSQEGVTREEFNASFSLEFGLHLENTHQFKLHTEFLRNMGFDAFRFSLAWNKLVDKHGDLNKEELQRYAWQVEYLIQNDIEPFVVVRHFDTIANYSPELRRRITKEVLRELIQAGARHFAGVNEPRVEQDLRTLTAFWGNQGRMSIKEFLKMQNELAAEIQEFYWMAKVEAAAQGVSVKVTSAVNLSHFGLLHPLLSKIDNSQWSLYKHKGVWHIDNTGVQTYNTYRFLKVRRLEQSFRTLHGTETVPEMIAKIIEILHKNLPANEFVITELGINSPADYDALEPNEKVDFLEAAFKAFYKLSVRYPEIKIREIMIWLIFRNYEIIGLYGNGWLNGRNFEKLGANYGVIGEPLRDKKVMQAVDHTLLSDEGHILPTPFVLYPNSYNRLLEVVHKYQYLFNASLTEEENRIFFKTGKISGFREFTPEDHIQEFKKLVTNIVRIYQEHELWDKGRLAIGSGTNYYERKLYILCRLQVLEFARYANNSQIFPDEFVKKDLKKFINSQLRLIPEAKRK